MQIGEIIRKYRKEKELTQEEMANRLGVTAPAVNKWENGNSLPDILLLAPIARLLDISLNTLLDFHGELTAQEICDIIQTMDEKFKSETYDEVFQWVKKLSEQYPSNEQLIWQTTLVLDTRRMADKIPDADKYDQYICSCYTRVLESKDEALRCHAADSLFSFYMRKEEYEKAERYLSYLSDYDPMKKMKQAQLHAKMGRIHTAYRTYEEMLFSSYQTVSCVLYSISRLAVEEGDLERAHWLAQKEGPLADMFEMGEYHAYSCALDLAVSEKAAERTVEITRKLLGSLDSMYSFASSPLYSHMSFKEPEKQFSAELKIRLLKIFQEEEQYDFLKGNPQWEELLKEFLT